jgi:hypothetical protein
MAMADNKLVRFAHNWNNGMVEIAAYQENGRKKHCDSNKL